MTKTITAGILLCAALLFPATRALAAAGGDENGQPGTANYFTAAQKMRAFRAATGAGFDPIRVEAFQDGNFFLTADKAGERYEVTVAPSGQVYPSPSSIPAS